MEKDQNVNSENQNEEVKDTLAEEQIQLEQEDSIEKNLALIREISLNVLPFSEGLFILKSCGEYISRLLGNKSLISLNFPLLLVPTNNFIILFFNI